MTTPSLSITLHIGAHKTATTHLQNSLAAAAQDLAATGVMFYGPRDFRWGKPTLQERFDIGNRPQDARPLSNPDALVDLVQGGHRVVLSEENFSGTLLNGFGKMRRPLYPDLPRRLSLLAARAAPLDVVLGIRNPAHILNSAYSQLVLADRPIPLKTYLQKNPFERVDWVSLCSRILEVQGVRSLTVWRHEDYGALFPRICRRMTGPGAPAVRPIPGRMHQGLSAAAVAAITGKEPLPLKDALARFPAGEGHPPFDAYAPEDHALSKEYYDTQIAELDAMPRLTRLKPT